MRGNIEKCREIAGYCSLVHVSSKLYGDQLNNQFTSNSNASLPLTSSNRNGKLLIAGGNGKI